MQNDSTVSSTAKALLAVCEVVLWISRGTGRKAIDDDDPNLYRIEILKNQYASCLEKRLARQCIDQDGNPRCDRHFGSKKVLFVRDYERLGLREVEY